MQAKEQEVGIKEVLEQLNARLNHLEAALSSLEKAVREMPREMHMALRDKADKWEVRLWFMTIMALLVALLGVVAAK